MLSKLGPLLSKLGPLLNSKLGPLFKANWALFLANWALFSKPDVNIIRYSTRAALTTVINPYADDDKFNKSTYIINSDFVEKIRALIAN